MTLDEAIEHSEEVASRKFDDNVHCIKCAEEHRQLAEWLKDYKRLLEQEPCEDAVSRQAVIDMTGLSEWFDSSDSYNEFVIALSELPPIIPKGVTITDFADKCRECGREKVLGKIRAEIEDTLYVDSLIFGELIDFQNGKISADDVIEEFNRVTRMEVLQIIDKYKVESESAI